MGMTIEQALNEIRSEPKWYYRVDESGEMIPKSTLIAMAQRIEDNRAKPETIQAFFKKFGYTVTIKMEVSKA